MVSLHQVLFTAKKPGSPVLDNVQLRKLRVIDLVQAENNPGAEGTFVWVSIELTSSSALPLAPGLETHLYLRPCANKRCFAAVSWLPIILHTKYNKVRHKINLPIHDAHWKHICSVDCRL